ncbi:DMT family transporter [Flavobacterium sp.]|uniref:DMT family transporter n=1 Tax=Flavobacterium sp. TaxID=239 RepID=UPI004047D0AF
MKIIFIYCTAFIGGVFLAIQAGFNTQLGSILKQPLIAVISTSITSALFAGIALFIFKKNSFQTNHFVQVPTYLWFIGGLCSAIGISLYFYTIPKLGISKMISFGLCGQLAFSLIAGKYGWLNLPIEPITTKHILGILSMIIGIFLINSK